MAQYHYLVTSIGDRLAAGRISDVSDTLLRQIEEHLNSRGVEGIRPLSVVFMAAERVEAADIHGNPFAAQRLEYAILSRNDPRQWEVIVESASAVSDQLMTRDGELIDQREAEDWQVIGYYRGLNSVTIKGTPMTESIWDSITVFVRPERVQS